MGDEIEKPGAELIASAYESARLAFDARRWADTVKHAAQVLSAVPHHAGAFELLSSARRQLERQSAPAGEQRILSVLMCDLVDSARLPRMLGREPYQKLLRDVQEICASAITRYEGRIAQYLGDGILAYFSYPQAHEDDPLRAALAALAIVNGIPALHERGQNSATVDVAVRIGIDLGIVMIGLVGAGQWTLADSIVGDPPNFAARLQAIAPRNGIIASAAAYERIAPHISAKALRARQFKGFDGKRRTYVLLSAISALESAEDVSRRGPLIGRDAERATLSAAWREVLEGKSRIVCLEGEAGMGKSRLADELINIVKATGGRHLTLRCSPFHRHVPFHPVAAAVRWLLGLTTMAGIVTVDAVRERLSSVVGEGCDELAEPIANLLGAPHDDSRLPEQRRERMLSVLVVLVSSILKKSQCLLLIEDVHDADASTLELIGRLAATVQEPMAMVLTSRPELDVSRHVSEIERIELGPLSDEACHLLASRILGARRQLIEWVVVRSGGSPMFAKELASWIDRGHHSGELPPALDLMLTARIDAVEPELRELLVTASVIGPQFEIAEVAALSGRSESDLKRSLDRLLNDGLLEVDLERPDAMCRFRHTLFREAAYLRLPPSESAKKHLQLAEMYEQKASRGELVMPAIVAKHFQEGKASIRALEYWHHAALQARSTAAHAEAVQHYEAAIALLSAIDTPMERARAALPLHLGVAESASMVAGYTAERVLLAFEQARSLADGMAPSTERFTSSMGLFTFALVAGQLERAEELVASAQRDVADRAPELAGIAHASQAFVRFFRGRLPEARALCALAESARPVIGVPQHPGIVSRFLLGMIEWLQGNDAGSRTICADAFRMAEEHDGERAAFTRTFLWTYAAWLSQLQNDAKEAQRCANQAIALAQLHGFTQLQGAATLHLGIALCELGEQSVGLTILEAALGAWRNAGAGLLTPYFTGRLAATKLCAGETTTALELVDSAIARARFNDEQIYLAELHRLRAHGRVARGDPTEFATEDLDRAIAVAEALGQHAFAQRAKADRLALASRHRHVGLASRSDPQIAGDVLE